MKEYYSPQPTEQVSQSFTIYFVGCTFKKNWSVSDFLKEPVGNIMSMFYYPSELSLKQPCVRYFLKQLVDKIMLMFQYHSESSLKQPGVINFLKQPVGNIMLMFH